MSTDLHGWLPCGSFSFVHRCTRIITDGLPCGRFFLSTDGHGLTRMGFLTEAFVFAKASRNYGNWGAKKFLFNNISRASGFRAEVYLSTDGHGLTQMGFRAEVVVVHGLARICTDGLPCGRFFVHGWARICTEGFLRKLFFC
jgi:hypothetical protein